MTPILENIEGIHLRKLTCRLIWYITRIFTFGMQAAYSVLEQEMLNVIHVTLFCVIGIHVHVKYIFDE